MAGRTTPSPEDVAKAKPPYLAVARSIVSDDNQTFIPRSFIDLFIAPGGYKPREPREVIAARYELCEDMAQMLTEHARTKLLELGGAESEVLGKVRQGLLAAGSVVTEEESGWTVCRLAELLGWPVPTVRPVD